MVFLKFALRLDVRFDNFVYLWTTNAPLHWSIHLRHLLHRCLRPHPWPRDLPLHHNFGWLRLRSLWPFEYSFHFLYLIESKFLLRHLSWQIIALLSFLGHRLSVWRDPYFGLINLEANDLGLRWLWHHLWEVNDDLSLLLKWHVFGRSGFLRLLKPRSRWIIFFGVNWIYHFKLIFIMVYEVSYFVLAPWWWNVGW